jgi:hypothetical protein
VGISARLKVALNIAVVAAATAFGSNTILTVDVNTTITLQNVAIAALHQNDVTFV